MGKKIRLITEDEISKFPSAISTSNSSESTEYKLEINNAEISPKT